MAQTRKKKNVSKCHVELENSKILIRFCKRKSTVHSFRCVDLYITYIALQNIHTITIYRCKYKNNQFTMETWFNKHYRSYEMESNICI